MHAMASGENFGDRCKIKDICKSVNQKSHNLFSWDHVFSSLQENNHIKMKMKKGVGEKVISEEFLENRKFR